ncbi:hypothetical protein [Actinokineospora globicatena]|uniref:Uncharacterized protein n=1 Tax=Actinokineospora globicatena TaxID=103729 RepID=A0A9W6QW17_9PSEU|nr:hypothetical protein [Actinokineospora globicatena]MCP2301717.1 hypothetical protein [Actinokineospora globicatena]GLW76626.1 hypothetical protein Aglo01_11080 [Actinokineospora globicatena]GLW83460.1 hypothetical protein Aglo02_11000 [Actinokineospora globicatena]GLW95654.1 hypothetical protein Aglo03_64700 [Actinokineospora globicatena]
MHDLDSALEVIRARDDTAAKHAHALWHVMRATAAHPTKVTRYDVQQMVWGTLPQAHRSPGGQGAFDDLHQTCESFAELLDLLGHDGYAQVCRAEATHTILDAAEDEDRYRRLVAAAWRASGVWPPDTPLMTWSEHGGPIESALHAAAGRLLEEAVDAGTLPVDGGDAMRVGLVMRLLTSPENEGDETWFVRLLDERLDEWTLGHGSQTRRELMVRLRPEVRRAPDSDGAQLPALSYLLTQCREQGARLTGSGYLPTTLVSELIDLMPTCAEVTAAGRSESQWPPVKLLRELSGDFGLTARAGARLRLTEQGAALVDDSDSLLMTVGERLVSLERSALGTVQEVVFAALLLEDRMSPSRVFEKVAYVLAEEGWSEGGGADFGPTRAAEVGSWFLRRLRVLDAVDADWNARRIGLTDAGRAIARWSLRARVLFRHRPDDLTLA